MQLMDPITPKQLHHIAVRLRNFRDYATEADYIALWGNVGKHLYKKIKPGEFDILDLIPYLDILNQRILNECYIFYEEFYDPEKHDPSKLVNEE